MADRKQLEELFISLILEDKKLEAQYRQVVERAKSVAKEIQTAIAGSLSTDLVDEKALDGAFDSVTRKAEGLKRALETAGQAQQAEAQASKTAAETITQAVESSTTATRNAAQAATGAMTDLGGAADKAADAATDLSGATRDTADSGRSFAEWATKMRQRLEDMRAAVRQDIDALDGLSDVQIEVASTGERLTLSQEELDEVIKSLTAQVASQRNLWASRVTSDKEFEDSTRALRQELLGFVEAGVLTDQQMRRVTQSAAYAQRGLDSVAGVASRGGLAWTTQIALSNQFGQSLRRLGPAGEVASQALGLVSKEMRALLQVNTGDLFGSIIGGLGRLSLAAGAAAAAVVTGVTVALFKMGQTAAESAEKLLTSATRASLSVETFQEYAFAAEQSGVQVEILTTTMQRLQRRAVDAQRGNAGLAESFDQLGVTLVDAQGKMLSTEELFGQVADGLVGIESDAERVALAFKIFDTEGAKLLPMLQRGSAGIQEMRDRARELGLIISNDAVMSLVDFKNSVNEAQKQLETSKIEILAGFMPAFTNLLIPLIQNTVVPWFQRLAEKVNEFTTSLRDVGPAGREFRSALAESLAPLVQIQGYAQAAGASLDILNYKFQLSSAQFRLWRNELDEGAGGLFQEVRGRLGFGPNLDEMRANVEALKNEVASAESVLADAIYKINNPGAITAEWVTQLATQVNETIGVLDGLGDGAEDAWKKATNPPPPPAGSLATLRQQLQEAQRDFELAVTNEARAAALERIRVKESEINTITAMMNAADPFAAATAWTQRLAAELRFGIKTASEVFDLIFPRIEELREEAATALSDFGVDSVQYQETVGKLEILERLLRSLGAEADAVDAVTMRGLQNELLALLNDGLEPTSEAVKDLLRQMNELELRGALEELRSKGVANLSAWARSVLEANGLLSDAVRTVSLTPPVMTANILEQPLAKVRFLIHQFGSGVETDLGVARTAWDDFERNVALGAASLQSALNAPSEAFRIFQDTILQMMQSGESMQAIYDAIARSPFAEAFSLVGFGEPGDPTEQVGLLERAYAAQQAAYAELQSAMTEEAIVAAGERYAAAQEEVRRLEALYATPVDVTTLGESVREKVVADLTAAGLAAQMFGTESELAAKQLTILEGAIMTLLAADPTAYVADLQMMWESIKGGAEGATEGVVDLTKVQNDLAAAQERLAQLTGEAPSEFDKLRGAFRAADAAGIEFGKTLEEILDLLDKLEEKADEVAAQQELANKLTLGVDIANGLTRSLEGIRDRDLQGALGGLTQLGTAIGTLIGGPAVGAIVQAIGQGLQAAVGLFQAISDLFTGDSPARRKLRDSLAQTVAGAFRSGIIDGLRGGEEWRENLKQNVQEAVLGAVVDAFIQAAVMQAIFAPFIDEFTKILHKSGVGAAFEFFDREFENFWQNAMQVVEGFVSRGQRYFKQAEQISGPDSDPLQPVTFELPNATVGVLAAPQWALELGTAAERIREAGDQMVIAAQMMQDTFSQGIPVTTESMRGIDAQRAL